MLILLLLLLPLVSSSPHQLHTPNANNAQPWIKSGYWHSGAEFPVPDINSALYTHLICAFARIQPSGHLSISPSDEEYFSTFTQVVKRKNPEVVTLLSIWTGPRNTSTFPPLITPPDHRKNLIDSSIKTARAYGFHGLDLYCIEPSMDWNMTHLGVLLDEWRAALDSDSDEHTTNSTSQRPRLILTMAVYYSPTISASLTYPIDSILRNVDWLHLTAYDYHLPTRDNFTQFHAALYDDPPSKLSTDAGVEEWMRMGLPARKLLLGLPFHGYAWKLKKANGSINLGAPAGGPAITNDGSVSYDYIKTFVQSYRVKIAYDARYVENYCTIGSFWISFDDVEAIRAKVSYAKEKKLLGYNVWEVSHDKNWVLSQAAQDEDIDRRGKRGLLLITLIPSSVVVIILATICCLRRLYKSREIQKADTESTYTPGTDFLAFEHHTNNDPDLQAFKFDTIKRATENFLLENKLGQGGFGPVYKGKLPTGQEIAVKRLSKSSMQGTKEFKNEVSLTAKLQHVNLVRLLGFCTDNKEKLLIYEYLPNKSLDFYLFDPERRLLLNWEIRVGIIEGVTQGLLYLQEYSRLTIIHRDLKAGNILLDKEMKPKISDLGMAKIFENNGEVPNTNQIVGTYGYIPPECVKKNAYSMKSDVFSFGVLLLQILSGKKNACVYGTDGNINLLQYAYEMWKEGMGKEFMDPSLDDTHSYCKMIGCMHVALLCVQEQPTDRPSMLQISGMLKNETTPFVTPKRPAFSLKESGSSGTGYALQKEICSTNDVTFSDLIPRE